MMYSTWLRSRSGQFLVPVVAPRGPWLCLFGLAFCPFWLGPRLLRLRGHHMKSDILRIFGDVADHSYITGATLDLFGVTCWDIFVVSLITW